MVSKYEILERTNAGLREDLERKEQIVHAQAGEINKLRRASMKAAGGGEGGGEGGGGGRERGRAGSEGGGDDSLVSS